MRYTLTTVVDTGTRFHLVCTQQSVWFRHGTLAIDPFRFHRIEPRTPAGQRADDDAHPDCAPLDLLSVLAELVPHSVAPVPGGVLPNHQQCGAALDRKLGRAPPDNQW